MLEVRTESRLETVALGARLGRLLEPGDLLALFGELGAGKTQLAKGIAEGLGVDPDIAVTSPTYTLLNIYQGRLPLYHFDLYRLDGPEEVEALGFEEYFYGCGVCIVEWPERLGDELPEAVLSITLSHLEEDSRSITFSARSARPMVLIEKLRATV